MASAVEPPAGPPAGFPRCPKCTYLRTGPAPLCLACASQSFEAIEGDACPICSQMLDQGECPNWLCNDPSRRIERIRAIAYSSGPLRSTLLGYKYDGKSGWALIFGRLLLGWLNEHAGAEPPDLIVASPTYVEPGGAEFGHTEAVIDAAEREDVLGRWPFDVATPRAIIKTASTPRSARSSAAAKRVVARLLGEALQIPDRSRTAGRQILVYDDVCTTGSQLNVIAGRLIDDGGAASVEAIVLARAPWRPRS